ncbi:MAG: hydrolase TatD [Clostridiales bacterium]|nr:hydrolase TatD [Clostridiales bacterium]
MRLVDFHTHVNKKDRDKILDLAKKGLWQFVSATNPDECEFVADLERSNEHIIATFGLHPWYTRDFDMKDMTKWIHEARIIGEIGLDTIWTSIPLKEQRDVFEFQLKYASENEKFMILHTKGAEEIILECLKGYEPSKVIVHWYSGDSKYLDEYIELGCYFTLGPDIGINLNVQEVCKRVPVDRLLVETDGIEAVKWALGDGFKIEDIPMVLESSIEKIAHIKGLETSDMKDIIYNNSMRIIEKL